MNEGTSRIWLRIGEAEIEVEGYEDFVDAHVAAFLEGLTEASREPKRRKKTELEATAKPRISARELPLAKFYKAKKPSDHTERTMVFSYWLAREEAKEEFSPRDIKTCYEMLKIAQPKNIPQIMKGLAAEKRGYLAKGSQKGKYILTEKGKDFVENELPKKRVPARKGKKLRKT